MIEINSLKLNINEIFYSIQGEGTRAGQPCIFIRLQGCMLRCSWCDTPYALEINHIEQLLTLNEIYDAIKKYDCRFVEFTGGEPLRQSNIHPLIEKLLEDKYTVAVETNGHVDVSGLDKRVVKIMDIKCPGSKMSKFNNFENLKFLSKNDEVKFVIQDSTDYNFAKEIIKKEMLPQRTSAVLLSPVFGKMDPKQLAEWILKDSLDVRMQLQLHKFIWDPSTRGV